MYRTVNKEKMEEIMKEVNSKFEKLGIAEVINEFLESKKAERIIQAGYERLKKEAEGNVEKAVPQVKENAKIVCKLVNENYENLKYDIMNNFKRRVVGAVDAAESLFGDLFTAEILINSIKANDYEKAYLDLEEVTEEIVTDMSRLLKEDIYANYIPEGLPEEVVELIRAITGGAPIIPIQAIFPEFGDEETAFEEDE